MQGLRVVWVGKTRAAFARQGVELYLKRIRALQQIECVEIRPASHSGRDPQAAVKLESDAILKRLAPGDPMVLLDEKGSRPTSKEMGAMLGRLSEGGGQATFVLGGPFGVDGRVGSMAAERLSLSHLTFPHQLARVILLEQLYRALTLQLGHAYHHD